MTGFGASRVLRLGSHMVLAWLLAPEIFGLMALVKVFMGALAMFSDIGVGPSIIQNRRGHDPTFLNTAWSIQVMRGIALWIVTCLLTWPFAWWYAQNDPAAWQLVYLLPVAGLNAVIGGFNHTALFTLKKELRLGRVTMIELATQVASLTVMIAWALVSATVWAMVAGGLAGALTRMAISHFLVADHPARFRWDRECVQELVKFGRWIMLSTAFTFLATNLDKLVLGKLLTLAELGLYGIALVFAKVAVDVASRLGSAVMFPVYSKFQHNPPKLMAVALRSREVVLWIGGAVCISIAVGSPLFFQTFWDPRYHYAGILAQWLVLDMWARILLYTMERIPLALGNSKSLFMSNVLQTSGILTAAIGYWLGGLPGFIVGLSVGPLASHIYLTFTLPVQKREMLLQSIKFSLPIAMVGLAAVGITVWLNRVAVQWVWVGVVILTGTVSLSIAALVAYRQVRDDGRLKSVPA